MEKVLRWLKEDERFVRLATLFVGIITFWYRTVPDDSPCKEVQIKEHSFFVLFYVSGIIADCILIFQYTKDSRRLLLTWIIGTGPIGIAWIFDVAKYLFLYFGGFEESVGEQSENQCKCYIDWCSYILHFGFYVTHAFCITGRYLEINEENRTSDFRPEFIPLLVKLKELESELKDLEPDMASFELKIKFIELQSRLESIKLKMYYRLHLIEA